MSTMNYLCNDQPSERDRYKIPHSLVADLLDDARIRHSLSKMASKSICKDNNINNMFVMTERFFDSDVVMSFMVERMQRQDENFLSQ